MLKLNDFLNKANVIVNCTEHDSKDYLITFIDFSENFQIKPYINKGTLTNFLKIDDDFKPLYNKIIDTIIESSNEHVNVDYELSNKFTIYFDNNIDITKSFDENKEILERKCTSKILNASNFIAVNGRIGPAQYVILNKSNQDYVKNLKNSTIKTIRVILDNYIKSDMILLGRKNPLDSPALQFIYYIDNDIFYYDIIKNGEKYFKQYFNIKIKK